MNRSAAPIRRFIPDNGFMFPPCCPMARAFPVLKVGERVVIAGMEHLGSGVVIGFEPDGRLVKLRVDGSEGWWDRSELRRVDVHE